MAVGLNMANKPAFRKSKTKEFSGKASVLRGREKP
jgi:hypothetical protein